MELVFKVRKLFNIKKFKKQEMRMKRLPRFVN